jgi:predicted dehydrogenase
MAPIKVGIIGYGFSAKCFNLPFILPNPELQVYAFLQRAAAPTDGSSPSGWGHCTVDFPEAKHYRTAEEFFSDPEIDLVIVCSHVHEEFVERSLNTGKHGMPPWLISMLCRIYTHTCSVVVEKPFTTTSAAADKLIALAKAKGKLLTVFQSSPHE